ncbi:MAG: ATP-dependent DNA helicase [Granulosicoccus sp.]
MSDKQSLRISVTNLADLVCRTGDLDHGMVAGPTAREGLRAHQRLQADSEAEVEVRLSCITIVDDIEVRLSGRVDLLYLAERRIGEIKSALVPASKVPDSQRALHWSQLKLYGYLLAEQPPGSSASEAYSKLPVELELIHVNLRIGERESDVHTLEVEELRAHAIEVLSRYVVWWRRIGQWKTEISTSAGRLQFPYDNFRAGQRDMSAAVYRTVRDKEMLLCEAPTGTGKTISSLFPAVKSLGEGSISQIAYLTAKVSGQQSVLKALRDMEKVGLSITALTIRAKALTCFCQNGECQSDDEGRCPMTIGFYDRLPAAREAFLEMGVVDGSQLDAIARLYQICPFEFTLQMLPWVAVVVCDYNYVFDPLVRLGHFSEPRKNTVLLVDEAHNLADRARGMYSGSLDRIACLDLAITCKRSQPMLARQLDRLANQLLRQVKLGAENSVLINDDQRGELCVSNEVSGKLLTAASAVIEAIVEASESARRISDETDQLGQLFRSLCRFVVIGELFSSKHRCLIEQEKAGRRQQVHVNLKCLDAADDLQRQYRQFRANVLFSATLRPPLFYRDILGLPKDTRQLALESPFNPENALLFVAPWIDTRYRYREESVPRLIELIEMICSQHDGNYLVFLPSYVYLQKVHAAFEGYSPNIETWVQKPGMTQDERKRLLNKLELPGLRIGFAILGGVFGEGIDYVGERLIGVIVVGVGLPGNGIEQELIADQFRARGLDGYDFGYRYPGFTRVLQTVGRLIRSESDCGVVVLADHRFDQHFYRNLFPTHWKEERVGSADALESKLSEFWSQS